MSNENPTHNILSYLLWLIGNLFCIRKLNLSYVFMDMLLCIFAYIEFDLNVIIK